MLGISLLSNLADLGWWDLLGPPLLHSNDAVPLLIGVSSLSSNSPFLLQPRRCCSTWTWRDWFAARPTFWYRFLQLIGTVVGAIRGAALPFFIFHVATFRWLERPVPAYQL